MFRHKRLMELDELSGHSTGRFGYIGPHYEPDYGPRYELHYDPRYMPS